MKKLVLGVTAPGSVILLEGQVKYFVSKGYKVYLITQKDDAAQKFCETEGCEFLALTIKREISVLNDVNTLFQIIKFFKTIKPDIVNVGTSKMGFLGTIAAFITRVPLRIYTARGLRFETEKGIKRLILMLVLKLIGVLAHRIVCISEAIRTKAVQLKLFPKPKTRVIGYGSSNGINLSKFQITEDIQLKAKELRAELQLGDDFVFGFVGRLNNRKGINELYNAFVKFSEIYPSKLVLLGKIEHHNLSDKTILSKIEANPNIFYLGFQKDIPLYMSMMDVFILPTWSEGFGAVFIQAAAMGIPVVGTRVSGVQNAVSENFNGLLSELKDVESLFEKMKILYLDAELRLKFSKNGVLWAQNFKQDLIWEGLYQIYNE